MVGRFVFRFQHLLELRKLQVEECEKHLAVSIRTVKAVAQAIERLTTEREQLNMAWTGAAAAGFSPDEAFNFQRYYEELTRQRKAAVHAFEKARKEENDCRIALTKVMTKHKALEKLRERFAEKHRQEFNRREQAQLDEFAVLRAGQEAR